VLHRDLIEATSALLSKFKSHRFIHVKAHTGNEDDLSKNNDVVDRMARAMIDDSVKIILLRPTPEDELFTGCPLRLLGPPVSQSRVISWVRANLESLPADVIDKHLYKAFTELCKDKQVALTKQTIQKTPMVRAERTSLQISHVTVEKIE
jgi:ribonuclease HI